MEEYFLVRRAQVAGRKVCPVNPARTASKLRELSRRLESVWMRRNKRSELDRVRKVLEAAAATAHPGRRSCK
jgi:hypothetical protein